VGFVASYRPIAQPRRERIAEIMKGADPRLRCLAAVCADVGGEQKFSGLVCLFGGLAEVMDSDAGMAWLLADAAGPCLTGDQRAMVFVELGCGENHLAIERILNAVVENGCPLSTAVLAALTEWLDLYVGSPEERLLRDLVLQVRAQRPDFESGQHCD